MNWQQIAKQTTDKRPGLKGPTIPDGEYSFRIISAVDKHIGPIGKELLEVNAEVVGGDYEGQQVTITYWLHTTFGQANFCFEASLAIPAIKETVNLEQAIQLYKSSMPGALYMGSKKTKDGYANYALNMVVEFPPLLTPQPAKPPGLNMPLPMGGPVPF